MYTSQCLIVRNDKVTCGPLAFLFFSKDKRSITQIKRLTKNVKEGNIILATKQFTSGVSIDRINLNKRFAFYQFLRSFVNL